MPLLRLHVELLRPLLVTGLVFSTVSCAGDGGGPYLIRGTARLPACDEAPSLTLDGRWVDQGTVEVTSAGCADAKAGERHTVCGLAWTLSQQGNEVEIVVDNEYLIKGRLCADTLYLEGGWWLPVQDEYGYCTYQEDDAAEVVIESSGNFLHVSQEPNGPVETVTVLGGTLALGGSCTGRYEIELRRSSS